jgi:prolipoprotein diacylglyceryltransferase
MDATLLHIAFDVVAWVAAGLSLLWLKQLTGVQFPSSTTRSLNYIAALVFGAGIGAVLFGTANLWLSNQVGVARSVEGGIAGGIIAIELYKRLNGIRERTGARFALPLAVGVAVGRVGCYLAGLDDFTYGTPTSLPFGHDFGDGIPRHPVQLYESAAMLLFAAAYVACLRRHNRFVIENGFYLAVGFYGVQRFLWEFIKPYGGVIGPLTLSHILSALLAAYAIAMIATAPDRGAVHDRAFA